MRFFSNFFLHISGDLRGSKILKICRKKIEGTPEWNFFLKVGITFGITYIFFRLRRGGAIWSKKLKPQKTRFLAFFLQYLLLSRRTF